MLSRFFLFFLILSIPAQTEAFSLLDYYTDKSIPVISSEFFTNKVYKGKVTIPFVIEDPDTGIKKVTVYLNKKDVTELVDFGGGHRRNSFTFDSEGLNDGQHILTVVAEDSSKSKNIAVQEIIFLVDNTAPLLKLASGKGLFKQGKTAIIYFTSSEPNIEVNGVFQGKDFNAYPYGSKYRAVIGFSIDDPGNTNYYMRVKAKDPAGNTSDYHYKIYVGSERYGKLSFTLKPKKVEMLMPDTVRADWKKIEDVVIQENDEKYYKGAFIRPTTGRISMIFGLNEFINGSESGRHRGIDFANAAGTEIKASNSGFVKLAEYLPAHGNTVVIEHGQGIFTYYAHLKKILVNTGTKVWKGQNIGMMGATGVATGPHLHFAVSLHNLRVDPMQWLNGIVVD